MHLGTFGNADTTRVQPYEVIESEHGLSFDCPYLYVADRMQNNDNHTSEILYNYRLWYPFYTKLILNFQDGKHYYLFDLPVPVSARRTRVFMLMAQDYPLVMVAPFMQHHPYALMSHADHPIESFDQLAGRTVTPFPGTTWISIVKHRQQVEFGIAPLTTSVAGFVADQTHLTIEQVFVTNEPYCAAKKGIDVHVLRIGESGWDPYRVIFTTREFAAKHPDVVRKFVRASLQGWQNYLHGDATAADAMSQSRNPSMTSDYIDFVRQTMIASRIADGLSGQGQADFSFAKLNQEIADLQNVNILTTELTAEDVASMEFLPSDTAESSSQP
ncbi:MAG: ABC transporter substrate-binding protein [Candidatus Synoicihabitans palmerolidicus]|nr:ABC transporter substrate-binding protein [Candidatus Synoicihabitans palmerolidicus]